MSKLTHFNQAGEAHMVDIADKASSARRAVAGGRIVMQPETLELIQQGGHKKGDVLGVARVAGIMATKRTAELVPMCHPLSLTHVAVEFHIDVDNNAVECTVTAETTGQTGVEMEAITAVSVAALTIYDMCKSSDKEMTISKIQLLKKTGGKSGTYLRKG